MQDSSGTSNRGSARQSRSALLRVVIGLRLRRDGQSCARSSSRPLWVVPVLYLVVAVLMFIAAAARGWAAIASVVGLAAGAAVGWQRGKMMHIHVDPETHALNQKASPAAMMFLIALIVRSLRCPRLSRPRQRASVRRC